jgi:hypothetical protein
MRDKMRFMLQHRSEKRLRTIGLEIFVVLTRPEAGEEINLSGNGWGTEGWEVERRERDFTVRVDPGAAFSDVSGEREVWQP